MRSPTRMLRHTGHAVLPLRQPLRLLLLLLGAGAINTTEPAPHQDRRLQLGAHAPSFSRAHPDANPGPRVNADMNLGRQVLRGDAPVPTAAYSWALDAGWSGTSTGGNRGGAAAGERYGQVTGVDVDRQGRIWVLQRTPERSWDAAAFTRDHHIRYKAPIKGNTIVRYASEDATAVDLAVGGGLFQMPHMIKVDGGGNVWVVDCGLHQVLKYGASAAGQVDFSRPTLSLGVPLQPGSDSKHFCKPTDVAIKEDGSFFVSDGYCNARVIYYSATGKQLNVWGTFGRGPGQFNLPHALAWDETRAELYVADRMNSRVQVFSAAGAFLRELGGRKKGWGLAFGLALGQGTEGGPLLYVSTVNPSAVFVVDGVTGEAVASFDTPRHPKGGALMPHDLGVTSKGTLFVGESKLNALYKYTLAQG